VENPCDPFVETWVVNSSTEDELLDKAKEDDDKLDDGADELELENDGNPVEIEDALLEETWAEEDVLILEVTTEVVFREDEDELEAISITRELRVEDNGVCMAEFELEIAIVDEKADEGVPAAKEVVWTILAPWTVDVSIATELDEVWLALEAKAPDPAPQVATGPPGAVYVEMLKPL